MKPIKYDYIIVGAGIAGCSVAYFLSLHNKKVLLLDRNNDLTQSASSAAGGFLSPLLGKPNGLKTLVTQALQFSFDFYAQNFPSALIHKGVWRIPKNEQDAEKFKEYLPYMDFDYELSSKGCFFPIGSQVKTLKICQEMSKNNQKIFDYEVKKIRWNESEYVINETYAAENLILTTGADTTLIGEQYFNIRAVWGQRIVVETSTCIDVNYHKECSISTSTPVLNSSNYTLSIGATHHRFNCDNKVCSQCLKEPNLNTLSGINKNKERVNRDTKILLQRANEIISLNDVSVVEVKIGARASSVDYFPIVGALVHSQKTLSEFPYLCKGTQVPQHRFCLHKNLFVLNGLGGRGFVLAPYLAKLLVEHMLEKKELPEEITTHRLFKRWAKKLNTPI